jgi:hypothetical protein
MVQLWPAKRKMKELNESAVIFVAKKKKKDGKIGSRKYVQKCEVVEKCMSKHVVAT